MGLLGVSWVRFRIRFVGFKVGDRFDDFLLFWYIFRFEGIVNVVVRLGVGNYGLSFGFLNKVLLVYSYVICLRVVSSCFDDITVGLSCYRDFGVCKVKNIYRLVFCRESLISFGLEYRVEVGRGNG